MPDDLPAWVVDLSTSGANKVRSSGVLGAPVSGDITVAGDFDDALALAIEAYADYDIALTHDDLRLTPTQ